MSRLRAAATVCALVLGATVGLAACGDDAELLPGDTAEQINRNLDQVRILAEEGDCTGAEGAAAEVRRQIEDLEGVDRRLLAALRQGANRLTEVVSSCGEEALAEAEAEREAEEAAQAELEEEAAVEAEEDELSQEREQQEEKAQKKAEREAEREQKATERETERQEAEKPAEEESQGKGPPAQTPGGTEPPVGGVAPGTKVE